MARLIGDWERPKPSKQFPKTVQVLLGKLTSDLDAYCKEQNMGRAEALRDMWEMVLNQAIEISPIPLEKDGNKDGVVTVPVTEEMYQEIEMFRGDIQRATVLRALTVVGLNAKNTPEARHVLESMDRDNFAAATEDPLDFL